MEDINYMCLHEHIWNKLIKHPSKTLEQALVF